MAKREKTKELTAIVEKALSVTSKQPIPEIYNDQNLGEAIHAYLEGYELTRNKKHLDQARRYADMATKFLWKDGLFVRQKGDPYYEAKLGTGDLVSGLLKLYLILNDKNDETVTDWSF